MKRILLISNKIYHYRVSVYNYLNNKLNSLGYELVVLTSELQKENHHEVNFTLIIKPFHFRCYKGIIARINPSIVICFLHMKDWIIWPLMPWLKSKNIKLIYWGHGINVLTPHNVIKNKLFGIFHAGFDAIVLYSNNEKKYIDPRYWHKIFAANNTMNFNDIPVFNESKEEIKRELNINFRRIVLFVGRIKNNNKRINDLIDASRYLDDEIGIVVVGGGISKRQLARIKNCHSIVWLGEIYDTYKVNKLFKMSDVFCIPGTIGLGINHAFYWGLPAITEDVEHCPEIMYLKNDINGYIVPKGNIKMLAEKINFLLSSPNIYERFSSAAKEEIMKNGNVNLMCDGFISAIKYLENF